MRSIFRFVDFGKLFKGKPSAVAIVNGSREYPDIHGIVRFYKVQSGVVVRSEFTGLPKGNGACDSPVFAFHIHSVGDCAENGGERFPRTAGHYNPKNCPHPYHAGDMPPLFSASGRAVSVFLTNRFSVEEIIEKSIIVHSSPDDFTTQPSGNAGEKIACGIIVSVKR
ncbi:MAG: superoxide dismutase family protein [Clostridia bacterium]|nr:superoxide dismutase family protein [Clostridia bacterium]MBR6650866.1 superoxide dismutase family protein [Clostridia bacterium]